MRWDQVTRPLLMYGLKTLLCWIFPSLGTSVQYAHLMSSFYILPVITIPAQRCSASLPFLALIRVSVSYDSYLELSAVSALS